MVVVQVDHHTLSSQGDDNRIKPDEIGSSLQGDLFDSCRPSMTKLEAWQKFCGRKNVRRKEEK